MNMSGHQILPCCPREVAILLEPLIEALLVVTTRYLFIMVLRCPIGWLLVALPLSLRVTSFIPPLVHLLVAVPVIEVLVLLFITRSLAMKMIVPSLIMVWLEGGGSTTPPFIMKEVIISPLLLQALIMTRIIVPVIIANILTTNLRQVVVISVASVLHV